MLHSLPSSHSPDAAPAPAPPSPLRLQASAAALRALTSAAGKLLSPLALAQLPQLLYPCSHSYCQTRRLLLTLTLTLTLTKPKLQNANLTLTLTLTLIAGPEPC